MNDDNVIGVFSEEQASRISGVSVYQLRQWDKAGFFPAAFRSDQSRLPFGRLYSFRDLVSLRVLDDLRNKNKIPLSHLRDVSSKLSHLGDKKWSSTTLYILGKRVVLEDPYNSKREDIVSGQQVFNIPLRVVIKNTRAEIKKLNNRNKEIGKFTRGKFISYNEKVFSGTRISVELVLEFHKSGYTNSEILREFPNLTEEDINAAVKSAANRIAA